MPQTKPTTCPKLTGSAVPSCLSDHKPLELKDIDGNDKFVQFGDVEEETVGSEGLFNVVDPEHPTFAMQQQEASTMSECMVEKEKQGTRSSRISSLSLLTCPRRMSSSLSSS
eukprot:TRINITY_DN37162_c0_g1_i1.p1 TRINITY_DN37162_c0_g1~~TRINITY_DN37162_c0_g1_i1.p1  ORF type:complete len:112 (-),score=28.43 TRINITY_DN37162_c0_g1_i1:44-379(-)